MKTTRILTGLFVLSCIAGFSPAIAASVDNETLHKNQLAIRARRQADELRRAAVKAASTTPDGPITTKTTKAADTAEQEAGERESDVPEIPSDEILKLLRAKGFGITGGYGQLTRSSTRVAMLQLRYNIIQQTATTYQDRLYFNQPEKQVAYGAKKKLYQFANLAAAEGRELDDMSDLSLPKWLSGLYLWAGWTNKEVTVGTEKAKPLFAGLSAGFGPLEKGASTVHLDVGLAFYENGNMPKDDVYIGLSVDVELFKKLISAF